MRLGELQDENKDDGREPILLCPPEELGFLSSRLGNEGAADE